MTAVIRRALPANALVARVLDLPDVVAAVRALPAETLGALVRHVGLEDAGELVALATPEQLVRLLDEDVWAPGATSEDLDGDRFGLWLAILLESGPEAVAARLVQLPEELVIHGLQQQMFVLDMDALALEVSQWDDDDREEVEKALESAAHQEIGGFRLISRGGDHFDAVVEALVALDRDHHGELEHWLERIADASSGTIEDAGGLSAALSLAEELAEDAAADRDARRGAAGYVATSDARAFLKLALTKSADEVLAEPGPDPITRAWFRELAPGAPTPRDPGADRLVAMLRDGGVPLGGAPTRGLPAPGRAEGPFVAAMKELAGADPAVEARRREEVAFLVNVLIATTPELRPFDALAAVVAACDAGLAHAVRGHRASARSRAAVDTLRLIGADRLFRAGWRLTHPSPARSERGSSR